MLRCHSHSYPARASEDAKEPQTDGSTPKSKMLNANAYSSKFMNKKTTSLHDTAHGNP